MKEYTTSIYVTHLKVQHIHLMQLLMQRSPTEMDGKHLFLEHTIDIQVWYQQPSSKIPKSTHFQVLPTYLKLYEPPWVI